jgi:multidrug efflux pump subunit AcrB
LVCVAIGIVVDDAIVVVENISRWMGQGLPPREATIKAMAEITGPVIAITLVLSAVFIPTAFIPGISGQFYRQFALTIAASTIISAVNALTMAPARAIQLIRPHTVAHRTGVTPSGIALPAGFSPTSSYAVWRHSGHTRRGRRVHTDDRPAMFSAVLGRTRRRLPARQCGWLAAQPATSTTSYGFFQALTGCSTAPRVPRFLVGTYPLQRCGVSALCRLLGLTYWFSSCQWASSAAG